MKHEKIALTDIHFIKDVVVGGINPNVPFSDESRVKQIELLNRCLNEYPKGIIVGSDISFGRFMIGQHELVLQRTTYHIGFSRKPVWLSETGKDEI